jgi:sulfite reductase alpha subunit-like flavoprotein
LPLTLGDDSVCVEEDFDTWQAAVLGKLKAENDPHEACDEMETAVAGVFAGAATSDESLTASATPASNSTSVAGSEDSSSFSWNRLELVPFESTEAVELRSDLWDAHPTFYHPDCQRWSVTSQKSLNQQPTANALHELELQAMNTNAKRGQSLSSYEAGDHLVVYPSQQDFLVEAYLEHWHISAATAQASLVEKVQKDGDSAPYPHPVGISLYDTLRYCVDLTAPPGPRFSRLLSGREDLHYKQDVFDAHATPLSLIKQYQSSISLEDLLYQLSPTQPRYYSIASSPLVHPDRLILTYRTVRYLTSTGSLQQGLCTSYLTDLQSGSTLMAYVNHNPSFRLPTDVSRPVIMLAGGCGVAAIRALVEEIQARPVDERPPVYLWVGFRDPADAAYIDLMQAIQPELLEVNYSASCRRTDGKCALVSDRLADQGELVYDLLQHQGAYLYACGGARTFGAAIQRELHGVYQTYGGCDADGAQAALQQLVSEGRYCEDLAD